MRRLLGTAGPTLARRLERIPERERANLAEEVLRDSGIVWCLEPPAGECGNGRDFRLSKVAFHPDSTIVSVLTHCESQFMLLMGWIHDPDRLGPVLSIMPGEEPEKALPLPASNGNPQVIALTWTRSIEVPKEQLRAVLPFLASQPTARCTFGFDWPRKATTKATGRSKISSFRARMRRTVFYRGSRATS